MAAGDKTQATGRGSRGVTEATLNEFYIQAWHDIAPPNQPGRRLVAQLDQTIAGFTRQRRPPALNAPPQDFAHTLRALADEPQAAAPGPDALDQIGLAGQVQRLADGSLRATDALAACFARIDRLDHRLNAVLWQQRAQAMAQAEQADRNRAAGHPLPPLHGVPLAHKDLFGEPGQPETAGSDFWRDHQAEVTATVMTRLRQAGSIRFAGLHLAEFAQNPTGHNAAFGDCINPWDATRIAGGSSSGSAVAVVAGYTTGALGTDTGGSIRLPAACCGVTGLKPTYGLVSRAGVVPLCASLDCVGPIARTARDCAILLGLIAGPDPADPTAADHAPLDYLAALDGDLRGQRIGVPSNWFCDEAAPAIAAAYHAALAVLADRGAQLVTLSVPLLDEIVTYGNTVARAEAAALHAPWMRTEPARFVPHVAARLYPGYAIPATYYIEAMQRRPEILQQFCRTVFAQVDALATPSLRSAVPSRSQTDMDNDSHGVEQRFFAVGGNVRPFNYLGLPAISLNCGFDPDGLPIGLQLVGRPFAEARLLRLADAYQRVADHGRVRMWEA